MNSNERFEKRLEACKNMGKFSDIVDAFFNASYLLGESHYLDIDADLRYQLEEVIIKYMSEIRYQIKEAGLK